MNAQLSFLLMLTALSISNISASEDSSLFSDCLAENIEDKHPAFPQENRSAPQVTPPPFFSARPQLCNGTGIFFFGEFLYWKAEEEGLSYALQSPSSWTTDPTKGVNGKISKVHSHLSPGFRVGADFQFRHDQWDLFFYWTSYTTSKRNQLSEKTGKVIWPFFLDAHGSPTALSAKAKWDLHFNVIDLDLGRAFFLGEKFSVKPYIGFEAAWIEQKLTANYIDVTFTNSSSSGIHSKNRNNFAGYGMNIGLEGKYAFEYGFYLFSNLSAAVLSGTFDLAQFEKQFNGVPRSKLKDTISELISEIQVQGGGAWERRFYRDRIYLNLYIAFEEQVWFNQNQLNRLISSNTIGHTKSVLGDLSLMGMTLGATFGF